MMQEVYAQNDHSGASLLPLTRKIIHYSQKKKNLNGITTFPESQEVKKNDHRH